MLLQELSPIFFLAVRGDLNPYLIFFYLLLSFANRYSWHKLVDLFSSRKKMVLRYSGGDPYEQQLPDLIRDVTWYSMRHLDHERSKILTYRNLSTRLIKSPEGRVRLNHPHSEIELQVVTQFTDKNEKEITTVTLYGPSHGVIEQFIKTAQESYETFHLREEICKPNIQNTFYIHQNRPFIRSERLNVKKTRENIIMDQKLENEIYTSLETFISNSDDYQRMGIPYKKSLLLYGIPGTGKTCLVYALSNHFKLPLFKLTKTIFKSNQVLTAAVAKIPYQSIILIDECDEIFALCSKEKEDKDEKKEKEKNDSVSRGDLLSLLDGYSGFNGCILILTTNHIDRIDEAMKRPGRIDRIYEVNPCNIEQIRRILKLYTGDDTGLNEIKKNLTSSDLINRIILPNLGDREKILELISE